MKIRPTFLGAILAGLSVVLGAFGAHYIEDRLQPDQLEVFKTGVYYQMIHAIGLIIIGLLSRIKPSKKLQNAAVAFLLGIILFSGSLYLITIGRLTNNDFRWIGPITPIGGISLLIGWGLIAWNHTGKSRN